MCKKMAPLWLACSLSLILLLNSLLTCYALLTYDRQTLLNIRTSIPAGKKAAVDRFSYEPHGSVPLDIPICIRRWPLDLARIKRRRKRGKRAGISIRWKAHLRAGCGHAVRCSMDLPPRWLRLIHPASDSSGGQRFDSVNIRVFHAHQGGVIH